MSARPESGSIRDYVHSIFNPYTVPNRTRDLISEITPNFLKNWRSKITNFFSFGSEKAEVGGH
jgi:hypothetical protein